MSILLLYCLNPSSKGIEKVKYVILSLQVPVKRCHDEKTAPSSSRELCTIIHSTSHLYNEDVQMSQSLLTNLSILNQFFCPCDSSSFTSRCISIFIIRLLVLLLSIGTISTSGTIPSSSTTLCLWKRPIPRT